MAHNAHGELALQLKQQARQLGFDPVGLAAVPAGERLGLRTAALERWLAAGYQADMAWMADPRRRAVEQLLPGVRSLLAVGLNYYVATDRAPGSLKVARYGWGRDYHRLIDGRLRRLGRWLEKQVPGVRWRACVDSAPLLDKAWAEEAGLGWIGKHGNLIHRKRGSWLLLGHLLTSLELPADAPAQPLCGDYGTLCGGQPPLHRLPHNRKSRCRAARRHRHGTGGLGGRLRYLPRGVSLEPAAPGEQRRPGSAAAALAAGSAGRIGPAVG